jgi:anti-anti-sigma regulatory factor
VEGHPDRAREAGPDAINHIGGTVMPIEGVSNDVLLITLPEQPQNGNEIDLVNKMLSDTVDRDVVVDFGRVKMLTSATICGLMILDRLLRGAGRQFVMCNIPSHVKQVFVRTGLMSVFEFSDNRQVALEDMRRRRMSWAGA